MNQDVTESFDRIVTDLCPAATVRSIEAGADHRSLWKQLDQSGYVDALVNESDGGAGLSLEDVLGIAGVCGRFSVPLPVVETMLLRAELSASGVVIPRGSITFANNVVRRAGTVAAHVTYASVADWVVLIEQDGSRLLTTASARSSPGSSAMDAFLEWDTSRAEHSPVMSLPNDLLLLQAQGCAMQMVGALSSVLERTVSYARERRQFNRPIVDFQAVQQNIALMAEHVLAAQMAVNVAASRSGVRLDLIKVAIAKARASVAAAEVAALSHAIHGAIGMTREFDLQLLTRRLHLWRQTAGSETHWYRKIGTALIAAHDAMSLDVVRQATALN